MKEQQQVDTTTWTAALAMLGALVSWAMEAWLHLDWSTQALLVTMVADVATGLLAGGKAGELDSDISWHGMRKKITTLILVGLCGWLGTNPVQPLPLAAIASGAFLVTEALSVLENSSKLGLNVGWLEPYFKRLSPPPPPPPDPPSPRRAVDGDLP